MRRFVYVRGGGQMAGDCASTWSRRMKINIHDIDELLLDRAMIGNRLIERAGAARGRSHERPQVRTVVTPDGRNVYVVDEQPRDTRTPRQQCVDEEVAGEGGSPSPLAQGAIDLKCSQR